MEIIDSKGQVKGKLGPVVQFDVCCKRDSKSLIVMTIFHINAILGEPGATKNSFPGQGPLLLVSPTLTTRFGGLVGTIKMGKPL